MNGRKARILEGITREQLGIEVAPWFSPLVPKRENYRVSVIDVFDRETLLKRAQADQLIPPESHALLEEVDYVGSATEIAALVPGHLHGTFDYIVSSHNFEHLPNPIKFLQGCEKLLKPGGLLTMAVPDMRSCFDFFRPHTVVGEWLEAFAEDRQRPSRRQVFETAAYHARVAKGEQLLTRFSVGQRPESVVVIGDPSTVASVWDEDWTGDYRDAHCTVMCPASLQLLLLECRLLGLTGFEVESVSKPRGVEFYVRLRRASARPPSAEEGNVRRTQLLRRIIAERGQKMPRSVAAGKGALRALGRSFVFKPLIDNFRAWNRRRRNRRGLSR
ncbi:MAG: methyltransferase domain-containing protein [Proteobacteria bacterium]|nr:methyltransferase domain-containing protein [Pseudomonadota bacterium]MBS0572510.1 methyltransferase domain-containing protein [Pseudomonadota bacterium]